MTKTIDGPQAVALLERVVSERGEDFIYNNARSDGGGECLYFRHHRPSCGVGLALSYIGVPDTALHAMDTEFENKTAFVSKEIQKYLFDTQGVEFDVEAVAVLTRFQQEQDHGAEYGAALTSAKEGVV